MILLPSQWHDLYSGIREDMHNSSEKKISIFVAGTDCDAICALKVLQAMLMASQISFSTYLTGYRQDLRTCLKQEFGSDVMDYRTAFCINCGSNENVHDIMESVGPMAQQFVRLVIIDSHRPIHHSLHDEEDHSCVMLHDPDCGDSPLESIPKAAASLELGIGHPQRRRRLDENGQAITDEDERQVELEEYYSQGCHFGVPASVTLFQLAHTMQLGSPYVLWMAVLGLTEQRLLRRASEAVPHYGSCLDRLEDFAEAMSVGDRQQDLFGEGFESDEEDASVENAPAPSKKSCQGRIQRSMETKLLMHRHWSLLEAMIHTPEVMARLSTFSEGSQGQAVLYRILATTGIPVQQASLQHSQMKVRYKSPEVMETLLDELAAAVQAVDSDFELQYRSFTVEYTSHLTLSAADHVHAVWAHLLNIKHKRCKSLHEGFWEAYKALDIRNRRVVQGLHLAMAQHRQLLQDVSISDAGHSGAHTVMSDGLGGHGQCLDLSTHDAWASTSPLVHPIALTYLAQVLQDTDAVRLHIRRLQDKRVRSGQWKTRPIVCVGPPDTDGICLVTAIPGEQLPQRHPVTKERMHTSHDGILNVYGSELGLFHQALQGSQVNTAERCCDSTVLIMHRHDIDVFLESLTEQYELRHQDIWAKEGIDGLL